MTVAVSPGLTAALKKVVLELEDDLRLRVDALPDVLAAWRQEHQAAVKRERTAMSWEAWRDDYVTQAAVAWVLTSVFVRFCEDNRLLKPVWIAGPVERRQEALDAELAYFRANPEHTDREWLLQAVEYLGETKATKDLVESHSPLWAVSPSGQAVKRLIAFWRERTSDGDLVWGFEDKALSTRFLGDLYQDLSDYAKKTFALLQTPVFVEEFILDQTMEPALKERPLEGFKLIDPACGSGHFLLGAFARLNDRWASHAPGLELRTRVQEALNAIHGVDLNPFAVAIARFRLLIAALQACEELSLEGAPAFEFHIAAGDSLLHGADQMSMDDFGVDSGLGGYTYASEDLHTLAAFLASGQYDVVVGNPPYITVKDKALNQAYRDLYSTCKGTYALTVPFIERFFQLARPVSGDHPAGWAGQITSNSFMKREFGSRLVEDFLSRRDLRLIIDTSGAYIPGHGTPTVILIGRPQTPAAGATRAVLGIRGEPVRPPDPANGPVWTSIKSHVDDPDWSDEWITVCDLDRQLLARHPWSLSGGGAGGLLSRLSGDKLSGRIRAIGYTGQTNADEAFLVDESFARRSGLAIGHVRPFVTGTDVREYLVDFDQVAVFPYGVSGSLVPLPEEGPLARWLWPRRTMLGARATFSGGTYLSEGRPWWAWHQIARERLTGAALTWAFVQTHNEFAYLPKVHLHNRHAPFLQLSTGASEADYRALLGVLNSSTACFWLKQNSHDKGSQGINEGIKAEAWERFYEFTGTTLKDFPLPADLPIGRARSLDEAARGAGALFESLTAQESPAPSAKAVEKVRGKIEARRLRMIAEQEELDWEVYRSYGLLEDDLTYQGGDLPGVALGERAFEIALARKVKQGEESTEWFTRHRSTPVTEIPAQWPQAYRDLVQRRLDLIGSSKFINLLERPEYKRRWSTEPWEKRVDKALRGWLLDRLEDRTYWFDGQGRPVARSVAQLSDAVSRDADLVSVLQLWSGRKDQSVTEQLAALLDTESVPYLAAYRLKDSGLRKREAWERTWDLQRQEDKGEKVGTIPVPPKYTSADFRKQSWWQHRGKLDVPKERFTLYPGASRETDSTQLLGWAGWDHAQQALALAAVIAEREAEGWSDERLVPLVAGLVELQPWVRQWHDETDATYQLNLADYLDEELRGRAHQVGMTVEQLHAWRPPAATRGRKTKVR